MDFKFLEKTILLIIVSSMMINLQRYKVCERLDSIEP